MKDVCDVCVVVPAHSTPQVESFHLALEHLICSRLKEKIEETSSPLSFQGAGRKKEMKGTSVPLTKKVPSPFIKGRGQG